MENDRARLFPIVKGSTYRSLVQRMQAFEGTQGGISLRNRIVRAAHPRHRKAGFAEGLAGLIYGQLQADFGFRETTGSNAPHPMLYSDPAMLVPSVVYQEANAHPLVFQHQTPFQPSN
jgi:hypothetical protein